MIERVGESEHEFRYSFDHTDTPPALTEAFQEFLKTTFGVDTSTVEGGPKIVADLDSLPAKADPSVRPSPPTEAELRAIFTRRGES
ncbi:hypothetical protein [Halomarina rubra]|uniref:Uncharacterized protein n=1 Tax=Halomarina rubra TaxID=2071873 RepID=A0ABD6AS01_9EURY|nr:hypothetical protein [Halomarina rubra]